MDIRPKVLIPNDIKAKDLIDKRPNIFCVSVLPKVRLGYNGHRVAL